MAMNWVKSTTPPRVISSWTTSPPPNHSTAPMAIDAMLSVKAPYAVSSRMDFVSAARLRWLMSV